MMNEAIWKTPVPSTSLLEDAKFSMLPKRKCLIEYSYETNEDDFTVFEELVFDDVESFKCTYYKACSLEMIDAYDQIIEIKNSNWLFEIKQNLSKFETDITNLKHLRIYFDDGSCYEFICRSFEVISKKQKSCSDKPLINSI